MDGRTDTVEAGSVIFYEPDKPHNLRNTGATPARTTWSSCAAGTPERAPRRVRRREAAAIQRLAPDTTKSVDGMLV